MGKAKNNTPKRRERGKHGAAPSAKIESGSAQMDSLTTAAFAGGMSAHIPGNLLFVPWRDPSKLSRKKWVADHYARRRDELLTMGITAASRALVAESQNAPDCAKPFEQDKPRYAEKLLRDLGVFLKAPRGSPKRRKK
jgi:hypothetical protein